jgi:FkbM family methyltransferase
MGASVSLKVSSEIEPLARGVEGVGDFMPRDETRLDFDFYIHALSLPRAFATSLDTIPASVPYLRVDPARRSTWAGRLGDRAKLAVGLVWAGSANHQHDRYRSITLESLAPILAVDGVRFVLLQKGDAVAGVTRTMPAGIDHVNLGPHLADFADTAAVIDQLDLVIGVDTAVAHLAGALAKPVWVLVPRPCDWRWLHGRQDSPWYPTMRLYRQSRRNEWDDVVERVASDLRKSVSARTVAGDGTRLAHPSSPARAVDAKAEQFSAVAETRHGIVQYLPADSVVADSLRRYGEFLPDQVRLLGRIVKPSSTVVEVGAGIGAHALALSGMVGEAGNVFAVEQDPIARRVLQQNCEANGRANVTILPRAGGTEQVAVDALRFQRLDLLKIGHGFDPENAFSGAQDALWRLRPAVFVTCEDSKLPATARSVKQFGYRCWRMRSPLYDPDNFNRREAQGDDRFLSALLAIAEEVDVEMALPGCVELED